MELNPDKSRSLSVVIPAYNEEGRLPGTLAAIHAFLIGQRYDAELIVVDDGSRDRTREVVADLQSRLPLVRLLSHSKNTGKGFAVFAGIKVATRETILFCDADLSTPIEEVNRLWAELDSGFDIAIGSRRRRDSIIPLAQPLHRRIAGHVFSGLVSLLCVRGIKDTQCGFKLFRAASIRKVLPRLRTTGFAFDVELLMLARRLGLRIAEVGVRWSDAPGSKVRPLIDGARMLSQLLKMNGLG